MMTLRLFMAGIVLTASMHLKAETLRDPTQLPSTVSTVAAPETAAGGPVLQSIILSDDMRAAIINGKKVNIGDVYQQSKLIALTENSATLQAADGEQHTLKMPHISFGIKARADSAYETSQPRIATKTIR